MSKIINFQISKGEDGYYVASANYDNGAIITQGKTFETLIKNIREAVEATFDGLGENVKRIFPPVMMNIDFSEFNYA